MLVFAAIAPHGGDIISQIAEDPSVMQQTRQAMQILGRRFADAKPDTVVIATPHGIIAPNVVTVGATRVAAGILGDPNGRHIKAAFETDLAYVQTLEKELEFQNVPYVRLVGEEKQQEAILPLDWGVIVPLWFTAHPIIPHPQIVVLAPDRALTREALVRTGVAIARAARQSGKRVAFIASCDLGHAHDPEGPYGYDPASAEHDEAYCNAIKANNLEYLLSWENIFLETAKVDAFWQTLILMGALGHTPMTGELLSYEAPTYFGMAVAAYEPIR
jgi:aromatic ring-opening dioxygenase LigB subunit